MPVAIAAATEPMRMSRWRTCIISWASTPSISVARQRLPQALGDAHHSVVRVAPGCECVGLGTRRDRHGWHRQVGALGEPSDHLVQLRRLGGGDHAGVGRPQSELVALPIREADDAEPEEQADEQPGAPAEQPADGDGQSGEAGQQGEGLERVLEHWGVDRLLMAFVINVETFGKSSSRTLERRVGRPRVILTGRPHLANSLVAVRTLVTGDRPMNRRPQPLAALPHAPGAD